MGIGEVFGAKPRPPMIWDILSLKERIRNQAREAELCVNKFEKFGDLFMLSCRKFVFWAGSKYYCRWQLKAAWPRSEGAENRIRATPQPQFVSEHEQNLNPAVICLTSALFSKEVRYFAVWAT